MIDFRKKMLAGVFVSLASMQGVAEVPTALNRNSTGAWYLANEKSGWYFDTVVGWEREPTYAGSDDFETELHGNFRAIYRSDAGHRYFLSLGEIGGLFRVSDRSQIVFFLEYEEGRSEEEDDIFAGFEDVENTLEGQLAWFYRWNSTYASVVLQLDLLDRGKGFVWFVGLGRDWWVRESFRFSFAVDLSGGNSEHMTTEFGVSEQASINSGLAAFDISGGLKSVSTTLGAEFFAGEHFSVVTDVEVESYIGDSKDSPLIEQEGSDVTYGFSAGLRYRF